MSRSLACAFVALFAVSMVERRVAGQAPRSAELAAESALVTDHGLFRASLERIGHRSRLWRAATEAISRSGRHVRILTPGQVAIADRLGDSLARTFDHTVLAEVAPVTTDGSQVNVVLVVINVPLLERAHARRGSLPGELHADLDRILVHEVYGHAVPYLLAGDLSGRCTDPQPGQDPRQSCAIQRENAVRAELKLGRRVDYGLTGLEFTRGTWR